MEKWVLETDLKSEPYSDEMICVVPKLEYLLLKDALELAKAEIKRLDLFIGELDDLA